jgi:hypothetical protein
MAQGQLPRLAGNWCPFSSLPVIWSLSTQVRILYARNTLSFTA